MATVTEPAASARPKGRPRNAPAGRRTGPVNHAVLGNRVFTTGQVARLCGVASRTCTKWCDSGRLAHHRIPGSLDRRVFRADLLRFLRDHGMGHVAAELQATDAALLVGVDPALADRLAALLPHASFAAADDLFAAGLALAEPRPGCVVFDAALGRSAVLRAVRAAARCGGLRVVVLACEDDPAADDFTEAGAAAALGKPADPAELAGLIGGGG